MVRTPASLVAVPLLAGAAAGLLLPATSDALALRLAGAAVVALIAGCGTVYGDGDPVLALAVAAGCALSGASLGVTSAHETYAPPLRAWFDGLGTSERTGPAQVTGVLREDAAPNPLGVSLTIDVTAVDKRPSRGGVRLSVGGMSAAGAVAAWRAGRTVSLPAILRLPATYADPGVPDELRALARRGIVLVGSVKSAALVDVVARGSPLEEAFSAAREWARGRLAEYVGRWSPDSGALAAAILIGDRSGLSDEDQRRLQEAGTYHVIAISGGNIAVLTGILLAGLRLARVPARAAAAIAIPVLLLYGQLTGSSASVARAVTGACVFLTGRILDHRGPALNALAIAAVAGVALSPVAVSDAGFILSFGATLGILLGAPRMMQRVLPARDARHIHAQAIVAGATLLVATICAELALFPVSAAVFSRVTFAGLVLNFAAIPLMAAVQAASMLTLAAAPAVHGLAWFAGYITHVAARWLIGSARLVDLAPWLARDVAPPAWGLVAVYYACCAACLSGARFARLGAAGLVVCVAVILIGPAGFTAGAVTPPAAGTLRVVFLDVGQGDATMVRMPDGRMIMVDTGGAPGSSFDVGERVVVPALRAFGMRSLDTLVLTHGDPDHIGGAPAVLRRFRPRSVWEGVPVPSHVKLGELAAAAGAGHAVWRTVQARDRERNGPVEIRVLHPPPPDWERQRVRNDDSVVIELRMGRVSIVLPGDIGAEGERAVVPDLSLAPIAVVKAPHHGSATSSTVPFVHAAHPAVVVFSAGRGNRFGHPAQVVVDRYVGAGSLVFRTDEDGAITMDTDGGTVEISTRSGRRLTLRGP
ncbi:MAG: competence protein ComEC [Acidobacteriota bacterium]|jgi:competence protein ComEC